MPEHIIDLSGLPDDVALKVSELGTPLAEYTARGQRLLFQLLAAPVIFLAGLGFLAAPLLVFLWGGHGGAALFKLFALGCILVPGAVLLSVRAYRSWGLRVFVFPEGLIRIHRNEVQAFFWDQVETIWRKKIVGAWGKLAKGSLIYTVKLQQGEEFHFDDQLYQVEQLGERMQQELLRIQWPTALAEFEAGAIMDFVKLRVSRQGLDNGKERVAWRDVSGVEFGDDNITINKRDKWLAWHKAPVAEIPNVHLLRALVEYNQAPSVEEVSGAEDFHEAR